MPKTNPQPTKTSVSIIGAGRLGQALALALQSSGYPIFALVARRREKAEKAAASLGKKSPTLALAANQLGRLPPTDLIIIATPDDSIEETARRLARSHRGNGRTALHTSGALSSKVLLPLAAAGFQIGSMHPLVSVSDPILGAAALRSGFYCLEGTNKARLVAAALVRDLGGSSFTIKPDKKALYHAAAVMAGPHVTALFALATEMLSAGGLNQRNAQKVLLPLLDSTADNLRTSQPEEALTGTFARGDIATVRKHLRALSGKKLAPALEVYKLLGLRSLQLAEKNGLDPRLLEQIRELLD